MKLKLRVSRSKPESMTRQITDQLTNLIEKGVLTAGSVLPSERMLADSLGVARNVVRRSYNYLTSGGHVESEGRRGKRVRSGDSKKSSASGNQKASASKSGKSKKAASGAKGVGGKTGRGSRK